MRIGLLVYVLDEEYQLSIFRGMSRQAKNRGVELICFQKENIPFELLCSKFPKMSSFKLDGMIILSSVVINQVEIKNKADVQRFCGNIPVVSIGQRIEGVPTLFTKSEKSMNKLIEHLVVDHSYRNFLFIRGSKNHHDSINRENEFISAINKYNKKFPELNYTIIDGEFTQESTIHAMTEYCKTNPKKKIDAIVCANDNMAIGVNKFIRISKPECIDENCAVTGFDDLPQASLENPPLTTIKQPMDEVGMRCLDSVLALIEGKEIPMIDYVDSQLIIRESCGCERKQATSPELKHNIKKMQDKHYYTERLLRMASHFGQDLNSVYSLPEMRSCIDRNIELLEIKNLSIISFIETRKGISQNIYPLYVKKKNELDEKYSSAPKINISNFLDDNFLWQDSYVLKYLYLGKDIIGALIYQAKEDIHPYICSVSVNIAQTIQRLKRMEDEFKYAENLEKEVSKRSKELLDANKRRIEVEAQVLAISEAERQRFSTDLHDDICQRLAGISMLCRSYSNRNEPVDKREMVELAELIGDTLQRTRQYAHNSYPVELESLGMNHSLSNLCASFENQSGIKCIYEWNLQKTIKFDTVHKLNIFRIIQEALHNVMKHSKATVVNVSLDSVKDFVIVSVRDNGQGIEGLNLNGRGESISEETNPDSIKKGLGFNSMQYRADQIDATFEIKPNYPCGTCVELKIFPQ